MPNMDNDEAVESKVIFKTCEGGYQTYEENIGGHGKSKQNKLAIGKHSGEDFF